MKKIIILCAVIAAAALAGAGIWYGAIRLTGSRGAPVPPESDAVVTVPNPANEAAQESPEKKPKEQKPTAIVQNLSIPWDIAFLPDGGMLVTERSGNLLLIENGAAKKIPIPEAEHAGEGGLLGLDLHPYFARKKYVYLYLTVRTGNGLINRVVRYWFSNNELSDPVTIIDNIPGAQYHDGGRIRFGFSVARPSGQEPYHYLYIATGDAGNPQNAQDTDSLAGKILRVHDDGSIPSDNPFGNAVWSYGHRNPQGLTWDTKGRLWATEHGRSGLASGFDELNLIEKGGNYGWPDSQGDSVAEGTIGPALHSGANTTWAPASAVHWDGSIFFAGLAGETLYEAILDEERVTELKEHFVGEYGRLRTVTIGTDGMFYLTTSNRDGRGTINNGDDKIIRVNPAQFR